MKFHRRWSRLMSEGGIFRPNLELRLNWRAKKRHSLPFHKNQSAAILDCSNRVSDCSIRVSWSLVTRLSQKVGPPGSTTYDMNNELFKFTPSICKHAVQLWTFGGHAKGNILMQFMDVSSPSEDMGTSMANLVWPQSYSCIRICPLFFLLIYSYTHEV